MATAKRKTKTAKKPVDPFTVVKSTAKKTSKSSLSEVHVPKNLVDNIDDYGSIDSQIKSLEAEKTPCKNVITAFAKEKYAERLHQGISGNFKLAGEKFTLSFITMARSSNIGQETYEELEEKWGSEVVEHCLQKDIGTVKFDAEVYEAHKDLINKTLAALGEKIGSQLFVGMAYKAPKNILETVADECDAPADLEELLNDIKIITQIRVSK